MPPPSPELELIPVFFTWSKKRVLPLPLDGMLVCSKVIPPIFHQASLTICQYLIKRGTVRVEYFVHENNTLTWPDLPWSKEIQTMKVTHITPKKSPLETYINTVIKLLEKSLSLFYFCVLKSTLRPLVLCFKWFSMKTCNMFKQYFPKMAIFLLDSSDQTLPHYTTFSHEQPPTQSYLIENKLT